MASRRPKQPGEPGNGMSPPGRCSHRGSPAGAETAGQTAAAGNAEETPSPEQKRQGEMRLTPTSESFCMKLY